MICCSVNFDFLTTSSVWGSSRSSLGIDGPVSWGQVTLTDTDLALIRSASAEVDTWHFNKWLILIIGGVGLLAVLAKSAYDLAVSGSLARFASTIGSTLAVDVILLVWLKRHWGRTRREQAIDLIQARIAEGDATLAIATNPAALEDCPG